MSLIWIGFGFMVVSIIFLAWGVMRMAALVDEQTKALDKPWENYLDR